MSNNTTTKKYIRTSMHTINFANTSKIDTYHDFIKEYRRIADIFIDFMWNNPYSYQDAKGLTRTLDIKNNLLDTPCFFDYNLIPIPCGTKLSARALSSLVTQCCGAIGSATETKKKYLYKKAKLEEKNEEIPQKFLDLIDETELVKPKSDKMNPELSSKNIEFEQVDGHFNLFIRLKCLGEFDSVYMPIKLHKQANKWTEPFQNERLCPTCQ